MAEIVTMMGTAKVFGVRPSAKLMGDEMDADAKLMAPLSDSLGRIAGEVRRLLCMVGDADEAARLIAAEVDAVLYPEEPT